MSSTVGMYCLLQLLNGNTYYAFCSGAWLDHLDKDDKEAEGSGVVEATRFLPEVGNTDDHVYETSCSPRQNLRLSFHLA